jgi:hypothetical protein
VLLAQPHRLVLARHINVHLNALLAAAGAPFGIQCSGCSTDSSHGLQLSVLSSIAGSTSDASSPSQPPTSSSPDAICISVAFSDVQLLLNGSPASLPRTSAAARKALAASDSAQTSHTHSSSSSKAHQQHPLGQSPPHTPTKDNSSTRAGQQGASQNSSASGLNSASQTDREAGVVARPVAARQLEAVLLSHSPRMLVIDGFFTPGGEGSLCCQLVCQMHKVCTCPIHLCMHESCSILYVYTWYFRDSLCRSGPGVFQHSSKVL